MVRATGLPSRSLRLVDLVEDAPSLKNFGWAVFQPPKSESTVTRFSFGNCVANSAATFWLRGR